jgi:actin-like ATPase involved in cell morphogenesis
LKINFQVEKSPNQTKSSPGTPKSEKSTVTKNSPQTEKTLLKGSKDYGTPMSEEKILHYKEVEAKMSSQFENQITKFKNSKEAEFNFPATLSGIERKIIHDIAEKHDLEHVSKGEENAR